MAAKKVYYVDDAGVEPVVRAITILKEVRGFIWIEPHPFFDGRLRIPSKEAARSRIDALERYRAQLLEHQTRIAGELQRVSRGIRWVEAMIENPTQLFDDGWSTERPTAPGRYIARRDIGNGHALGFKAFTVARDGRWNVNRDLRQELDLPGVEFRRIDEAGAIA